MNNSPCGPAARVGLSAGALKLIALCAMLGDHIAWIFVPTYSPAGQALHVFGRLTAPVMCYFVAEGFFHTRSVPRYAARLLAFAAVSYLPFIFYETRSLPTPSSLLFLNVGYTLLCGLLALWAWQSLRSPALRLLSALFFCLLAQPGDWGMFGVLFVLAAGVNRGNFKRQALGYAVVGILFFANCVLTRQGGGPLAEIVLSQLFQLSTLLSIPLLRLYNGQRGRGGRLAKWGFYIFYPAHLCLIGLITLLLKPPQ